jgi:ABC-type phosphate transport system auxiliary subunit
MTNRMITIPEDLNDKLKLEENASKLIQQLLNNHYNLIQTPKEKLDEVKHEIEKKTQEAEALINKVNAMELKKAEILNNQIAEAAKEEDSTRRLQLRKQLFREAFNSYDIPKEKIEDLFNEFMKMFEENKIERVVEFMQLKQIERKPPKQWR